MTVGFLVLTDGLWPGEEFSSASFCQRQWSFSSVGRHAGRIRLFGRYELTRSLGASSFLCSENPETLSMSPENLRRSLRCRGRSKDMSPRPRCSGSVVGIYGDMEFTDLRSPRLCASSLACRPRVEGWRPICHPSFPKRQPKRIPKPGHLASIQRISFSHPGGPWP